jgi:hypothetical protein
MRGNSFRRRAARSLPADAQVQTKGRYRDGQAAKQRSIVAAPDFMRINLIRMANSAADYAKNH